MKLNPFVSLLIGAAIGAAAALWFGSEPSDLSAPTVDHPEADTAELEALRKRLRDYEAALAEARREALNLRDELAEANTFNAPDEAGTEDPRAQRAARMQRFRENALRQELDEIASVVGLAPGQRNSVEAALRHRQEQRMAEWEARRRGEPVRPPAVDFEAQIASILDPGQLETFRAYETALTESRLETGATARMNRIAPRLGLSEEQKDAVFGAFHEDLRSWTDPSASLANHDRTTLEEQMRAILSPEQFDQWQSMERTTFGGRRPGS